MSRCYSLNIQIGGARRAASQQMAVGHPRDKEGISLCPLWKQERKRWSPTRRMLLALRPEPGLIVGGQPEGMRGAKRRCGTMMNLTVLHLPLHMRTLQRLHKQVIRSPQAIGR